ncbi:CHAP domain-containing protein [Streptomyces sp. NBC_01264]|uniref:CHAP domain-containing protein n=1 Tax=Streptomyces sp. NBC_01264 TaxID=2903804 RepID=UPI00225B1505|nr:CHAP domain-containing protein [Streptomyces sp. NBC_01264]MCX4779162.1 CHAP domain-containing protein [Streptomyces sp. NBC_01264]
MSRSIKTIAIRIASTSALAATAFTMVVANPASASTLTDGIAATARAEEGNGACAHGGYDGGPNQYNSCSNGRTAHAWCADFAGWVWARNGVTGLATLTDGAASFMAYGKKYGTITNTPHVGDAVVFDYNGSDWAAHVALVTGVSGDKVTITGGNQGGGAGHVSTASSYDAAVGERPWGGQKISGYVSPAGSSTPSLPNPASLAEGTLVKSASSPAVKVLIKGAGLAVAASDVTPDKYDMSKVVTIDDQAFRSLFSAPPSGTVVHDQAGGADRYVIIGDAALKIGGADWVSGGYNTRADMGVPTSWLKNAAQRTVATGIVVMDQSGTDPSRYVMVAGSALHISGSEWTADKYNEQTLMGVPAEWLKGVVAKPLQSGTVVMNQSGTDSSRYVMVGGTPVGISATEWTSVGFDKLSLMGVPGEWLGSAVTKQVADGTIVKDASGSSASVYVMAGGVAVPLTNADFTGFGYDQRPLDGAPAAWLASAAAKAAPANGTMVRSLADATVWEIVNGKKRAMAATEFGAGKRSFDDVVGVGSAFIAKFPTA